ncbi:hypothetical protein TIFTF001_022252 [Ficus carica]|uniref:LOB domain-containing protein n=1 Tax=Ficus carica TaxID=3494 RepID=A0AA88AZF5_FICCA|nr:hypothetical protein TIFTF001_022252 [Ficus carica]
MSSDMEEDDLFYLYPPCAACKTQRKRCNMFCEVSSLFPQTKSKEYQNAHRLFGSSNIQKMIVSIKPSEVDVCADSILTEGLAGKNDPEHGCYGLVGNLKAEVDAAERELAAIKRLLALCKNDQATDAAAAAIARQMILRRGGLNIPVPPVPDSPELSLSLRRCPVVRRKLIIGCSKITMVLTRCLMGLCFLGLLRS